MIPPADWLPLLRSIADEADAIALRFFRSTQLRVETKANASPVSEADLAIEAAARRVVKTRHPGLGILGEEEGETGTQDARLILDPIDGTRNFIRGIPVFGALLAIEVQGEVVAGLVSAPALGQRWHAARGHGAWSGDRQLRASGVGEWSEALVLHGSLAGSESEGVPAAVNRLVQRAGRTRGFGDFWQHMLVAEGAAEIALDPQVAPWDIAALQVIVEEAGGRATTLTGERTVYGGSLVTTNDIMHRGVIDLLAT